MPLLRVEQAQAHGSKRVRVTYSAAVLQADPAGAHDALNPVNYRFHLKSVPAASVVAVSVSAVNSSTIDVTLDIESSSGKSYEVEVRQVQSALGEALEGGSTRRALFAGFVPPTRPKNRDFDLYRMLPELNRQEDATGDLAKFVGVIQDTIDLLLDSIDAFPDIIDPDRAPLSFVELMLLDLGNPFAFALTEIQKRRLAVLLIDIYKQVGTPQGIRNAIRFLLGINVTRIDAFHVTSMRLGFAELGVNSFLGSTDARLRYSFNIEVERALSATEQAQIRTIADFMKPAHTHLVRIIEPTSPEFVNHWELGVSELGVTSILHEAS